MFIESIYRKLIKNKCDSFKISKNYFFKCIKKLFYYSDAFIEEEVQHINAKFH